MYRPFGALLDEEAGLALTKSKGEEADVSEKDLPNLASALDRYYLINRMH